VELKLGRSMTINTGNFNNVKPTVELSDDVDKESFLEAYEKLSEMLDALMGLESIALLEESDTLDGGVRNYLTILKRAEDKMKAILEK